MSGIEVRTQEQLDAALLVVGAEVHCVGDGYFELWGSSHAVLWESSHAELRESSRAEATQAAHVVARDAACVTATTLVAIHIYGSRTSVVGGVQIQVPDITTAGQRVDRAVRP